MTYTMMQACRELGMTYQTLKFYCNQGLVPNVKRDKNNRRVFDERDVEWLRGLGCLKRCGLSIEEMREYLDMCLEGESSIPARKVFLAEKREKLVDYDHTRVATKFPHIAEQFFNKHGMQMEYIKLNGSIELGPIVGLSESIVDIVETGTTLRENDLEEIAYILDATARLIVNRVSFKLKFDRISQLTEELRRILELEQQAKAEA